MFQCAKRCEFFPLCEFLRGSQNEFEKDRLDWFHVERSVIRPILPFKASFVDSHITMFQCGQFDHEILRVQVTKRQDLDDWRFTVWLEPIWIKVKKSWLLLPQHQSTYTNYLTIKLTNGVKKYIFCIFSENTSKRLLDQFEKRNTTAVHCILGTL